MSEVEVDTSGLRSAASIPLERQLFMRQAGLTFNGKRDLYGVLGYTVDLSTRDFRSRYSRGGIASRIVEAFPKDTWRGTMELVEDEDPETDTAFEQAWKALSMKFRINSTMLRADILSGLSTFSVLLLGAPGQLNTELPRAGKKGLLYLTPFSGGGGPGSNNRRSVATDADASIMSFDMNTESERFGLPEFYQLRRVDVNDPNLQVPVHWSRILHLAEGCLDDEVYGTPVLQNVWNYLDDLDKVVGGGAEAFWLRANAGVHLNIAKEMGGNIALSSTELTELSKQADEYQHQLRRMLRTRGVEVEQLGSDVADFKNQQDAIITLIAGTKGIPKRLLVGSEMGELASTQDRDNWKDQINGRQIAYAEPYIVRPLVDRLIKYGYLPTPVEYNVRWPQIEVLSELDKAKGALSWSQTNQANGMPVYTGAEIRDHWNQMEPLTDEEKQAEIPEPPEVETKQVDQLAAAIGHGKSVSLSIR